jgi:predicted RNA-binding Zn-ribbon protein involved in translation (DUF1610 family)
MTRDKVIIVVRGGVAEVLDAPKYTEVMIIDFDNLEGGQCPICGESIIRDEDETTISLKDICDYCGYRDNMTEEELIELAQNYYPDGD